MLILLQFSRRFLHRHPGQLLLALIGVAAGVAVVTGVALLRGVLLESLDAATDLLAGDQGLRIEHASGRIDEHLFAALATAPGAPALVPVLRARARLDGELLEILAIDPLAVAAGGPMGLSGPATGALLNQPGGVLVGARSSARLGLVEGEPFTIRVDGRPLQLHLVAILADRPGLDQRLIMDLAWGQQLLDRPGQLSWIEAPASARAWLESHLAPELTLSDPVQRRASAERLTRGMRANLTAMSLLALLVGLFVIHAVLSFLLVQRQRQIGMLRAVGVSRGRIAAVVALETALLAGLGGLIGLVAGTWLAERLLVLVRSPASELYGLIPALSVQPGLGLYAVVWLIGVSAALLGVIGVLRQALAIAPGQLSRRHDAGRSLSAVGRLALAGACSLSGLLILALSSSLNGALLGLFGLLAALALLAPDAGLALLGLWQRLRRGRLSGQALGMLRAGRQRLAPALAALSLALGLSAGLAMMVISFRAAVDDWVDRLLRADVYLTVQGGSLTPAQFEAIIDGPEIADWSSARQRDLGRDWRLIAYELNDRAWAGFEWLDDGGDDARAIWAAGDGVLISEPKARRHALRVGDRINLPLPGESRELPVLGIYRDYSSDRGVVAIAGAAYQRWFDDALRDSLGLYLRQVDTDLPRLRQRLETLDERLTLTTREAVRSQTLAVFDRTFRITWALSLLVAIIAAVALTSALLALGLERAREYATLRALGLTPAGLRIWVISQTAGLALVAAVLALPISLLIQLVLTQLVQPRAFGWTMAFSLPWQPWLAMLPLALVAGVLSGLYPAWKLATRAPAPLLKGQ